MKNAVDAVNVCKNAVDAVNAVTFAGLLMIAAKFLYLVLPWRESCSAE